MRIFWICSCTYPAYLVFELYRSVERYRDTGGEHKGQSTLFNVFTIHVLCVVLWRGWCGNLKMAIGTLKSVVWYFEEGYWYFEEGGVVL